MPDLVAELFKKHPLPWILTGACCIQNAQREPIALYNDPSAIVALANAHADLLAENARFRTACEQIAKAVLTGPASAKCVLCRAVKGYPHFEYCPMNAVHAVLAEKNDEPDKD